MPYSMMYVEAANKPDWLLKVNPNGTVPVMRDVATEEWIVDSSVIMGYLEEKHPEPKLGLLTDFPPL